jgi:diadenosine tetraphosphate (Ap4A) HIT family hydrolase
MFAWPAPVFPSFYPFSSHHDLPAIVMGCPWLAIRAQISEVGKHVVAALRVESATIGFQDREGDQGHTHIHVVPRLPGGPLAYLAASVLVLIPCFWQSRLQAGELGSDSYNAGLAQRIRQGQAGCRTTGRD